MKHSKQPRARWDPTDFGRVFTPGAFGAARTVSNGKCDVNSSVDSTEQTDEQKQSRNRIAKGVGMGKVTGEK